MGQLRVRGLRAVRGNHHCCRYRQPLTPRTGYRSPQTAPGAGPSRNLSGEAEHMRSDVPATTPGPDPPGSPPPTSPLPRRGAAPAGGS
jgi:hypothetical protein